MNETLYSVVGGTAGLSLALVGAIAIGAARSIRKEPAARERLRQMVWMSISIQSLHFLEEATAGFHVRFPLRFGLAPWPLWFFVSFNLAWISIWVWAGLKLTRPGLIALWFLAIAAIANGAAHPLLAVDARSYFPGLLTSPLVGIAGIVLLRRLFETTAATPRTRSGG